MKDNWIPASNHPKRLHHELIREIIIMRFGEVTFGYYIIPYGVYTDKYGQDITGELKWWQPLPEAKGE